MPTVKDIHEFLQTLAPESMAEDWDHVGLVCGRSDRPVQRILVALDPFMAACQEAKDRNCQLLVTHHPAIFQLRDVNDSSEEGRILLFLIENGISALNAHTNLDLANGGVNDALAEKLGLREVHIIDPVGTDPFGKPYGLLRGGRVDAQTPEDFAAYVKKTLSCPGLRYAEGGREIRRVAVGGGSCYSETERVAELGYDAFVTADCKYNSFASAKALGLTLIDAGHFETENPVCSLLAEKIQAAFPEVQVLLSKNHSDCIKFA